MRKFLNRNKLCIAFMLLLLVVSGFFRLYRIDQLSHFQYDQARDALYTKRLVVDHKLRLIGPQASPGFYTGPAYYYLMAPFLAVSKLDPSGMDFGVAFFGVLTVGLLFVFIKYATNNTLIAFIFSLLYAINPEVISRSRFSWNPNITPFFFLLLLMGLLLLNKGRGVGWYLVAVGLGILLNLHFVSAALLPGAFILIGYMLFKKKWHLDLLAFLLFIFLLSPYVIIDLKYNFVNIKTIITLAMNGQAGELSNPINYTNTFDNFQFILIGLPLVIKNSLLTLLLLLITILLNIIYIIRSKPYCITIFSTVVLLASFLLSVIMYKGNFYPYYLTFVYPVGFIVLATTLNRFVPRQWQFLLMVIILPALYSIKIQFNNLYPTTSTKETLYQVASIIESNTNLLEKFNIVGVKGGDRYDHNAVDYRYFTETFYNRPTLDWDVLDYQNTESLFVVDHTGATNPLTSNIWEIGLFKPATISGQWVVGEGEQKVTIYRLEKIHQ